MTSKQFKYLRFSLFFLCQLILVVWKNFEPSTGLKFFSILSGLFACLFTMLSYSQTDDCFHINNGIHSCHVKAFEREVQKSTLLKAQRPITNKRTCKVSDLSSPLLYHGTIGCIRSVKDCPTAYRLRLVP